MEEERLEKWRRARGWLNREGSADLRFEDVLIDERDLVDRSEMNCCPSDCVGGDTEP
jgi:hypothetical protein